MKLIEMSVNQYLETLISDAPAPGGGSVSALAGAQGAALIAMVCDLTTAKKKYESDHDLCREIKAEATALYDELRKSVDLDTDAYNLVADAFKMPKSTDDEKAARKAAIAAGTLEATKVPYNVMRMAGKGLDLAKKLNGHFNTNCASDFGVGVLNFLACMQGAWLNVKINLPGVKDADFKAECSETCASLISEYTDAANALFSEISNSL